MEKQRLSAHPFNPKQKKLLTITIEDISDNLIRISYPYNVVLNTELLKHQDSILLEQYHRFHSRLPQLLIQLDGIAEFELDCKDYLQSNEHQRLYSAVAFVLGKGNMSVLERHYLEQLLIYRTQKSPQLAQSHYPVGVFATEIEAKHWLNSKP